MLSSPEDKFAEYKGLAGRVYGSLVIDWAELRRVIRATR